MECDPKARGAAWSTSQPAGRKRGCTASRKPRRNATTSSCTHGHKIHTGDHGVTCQGGAVRSDLCEAHDNTAIGPARRHLQRGVTARGREPLRHAAAVLHVAAALAAPLLATRIYGTRRSEARRLRPPLLQHVAQRALAPRRAEACEERTLEVTRRELRA